MVVVDNSYLLGLFGVSSSSTGTSTSTTTTPPAKKTDPTPPWDPTATAPRMSALVTSVMAGHRFVDVNAAQLDVPGASSDYKSLFALYQGLNALDGVAGQAAAKGVSALQLAQYQRVFASGLKQVGDFMSGLKLDNLQLVQGAAGAQNKSTGGVQKENDTYVGPTIQTGSSSTPVAAFDGDVRFSMNVKKFGVTSTVSFDLSEMGSAPRTLSNVVNYMNDKLAAAGVRTRFGTVRTAGQPQTVTVGGKPMTLPAGPDQYSLKIVGDSTEAVSFTAPAAADAVYMAQSVGKTGATSQQLTKFQTDANTTAEAPPAAAQRIGDSFWSDGRAFQQALDPDVTAVKATATAPDGSVYVLATVNGTVDGQDIKGTSDVALMKYDSAGKLISTRTLGAAQDATGYALAVSADGKVAIAGSVTGALDSGDTGLDAKTADSFVTVYDANGDEMWTQRRAARDDDSARGVTFGADGSVYVVGQASSTMLGATGSYGGADGYLEAFSAKGTPMYATQFGTAGTDRATSVAMDGTAILVGSVENGHAVVRRYEPQASGPPALASTRDLGDLQGGDLAGIAVRDGQVIVAGTTHNGALDAGSVTRASGGGSEAFVASMDASLAPNASDALAYYGGSGNDTATALTVTTDGRVYIAGQAGTDLPNEPAVGTATDAHDGYLAEIDPRTGTVGWSTRFSGKDGQAAPTSIAVAAGGASILDRLGLPQTVTGATDSQLLVAGTSVRAGDRFYVQASGSSLKTKITIDPGETWDSLSLKIQRATGFRAKVTKVTNGDLTSLKIEASDTRNSFQLFSGESGRDALEGLGISPGLVQANMPTGQKDTRSPVYGLQLPQNLDLSSPAAIKAAQTAIEAALSTIRTAYRNLAAKNDPAATTPAITGTPPKYLTDQIANYQAALARLSGG